MITTNPNTRVTHEIQTSIRELHSRTNDGIHVRLLWRKHDGRLWVDVVDTKAGDAFALDVRDGERPLDVFHHPYAYAAHHGIQPHARPAGAEPAIALAA
jgi:hypothetical protein